MFTETCVEISFYLCDDSNVFYPLQTCEEADCFPEIGNSCCVICDEVGTTCYEADDQADCCEKGILEWSQVGCTNPASPEYYASSNCENPGTPGACPQTSGGIECGGFTSNYCCQTKYDTSFGICNTKSTPEERNCLDCSLGENDDICSDCDQTPSSSNGCERREEYVNCFGCDQIPAALAPPTSPANSTPTTRRSSEESYRRRKVLMPDGSCVWIITGVGNFIEYPDC